MFTRLLRGLIVPLLAIAAILGGGAASANAADGQSVSLSSSTFDFGDVHLGLSAGLKTVRVTSTGTAPLYLGVSSGTNDEDVSVFAKTQYDPLLPGAHRDYYVTVDPSTTGKVDATTFFYFGDNDQQTTVPLHVTYNALPQVVYPYKHFDLGFEGDLQLNLLYGNTKLRPIGGTAGAGRFVFRISSGTVSPTDTGLLSSPGGLEIKHGTSVLCWRKIGLDLTHRHLTAVVGSGPRINVADLTYVGNSYDIEGNPTTFATYAFNATSAKQFNTIGVRPKVTAGQAFGSIQILK